MRSPLSYVLISPCRNEAAYMRETLDSVIAQSVTPTKWVIVDDGSTDATPEILSDYARRFEWIEVVTISDRGRRLLGPGVVDAFYAGYEVIDPSEYEHICKLDMDLILPPKYFEILMDKMSADPRLATCSGKAYIVRDGKLLYERHGDDTSIGATKFYRMSSFQENGGLVRQVGWDGIDCHQCRMRGWIARSWDEPDLRFVHLRPMGTSYKGVLTGRRRDGYGRYYMGTGFLYMAASAISRMNQKPYILGGSAMIWGWLSSAIKGLPRYEDVEFRKFLRRYQRRVLIVGKARAMEELENFSRHVSLK